MVAARLVVLALVLEAVPASAMRIVSLAPSVTETLFALGAGGEVVGVSTYCDYPPEAARIDRVGTFLAPNSEVIAAKQPDLVIAVPSPANRASVEALERIGLTVLVVDPETIGGIRQAIERIAAAIGRQGAGQALIGRLDADLEATRAKLRGVRPRRTLMVVGHSPLVGVGTGIYLDELIEMAGGRNVGAAAGGRWPHLSLEFVLAQAPEVIVDTTMGSEVEGGQGSAFWGAFANLPAVRDGRVYGYREYSLLRPGPRVGEALATLARYIHPERFES
jgi:iron complex transport system substrate-binding protein